MADEAVVGLFVAPQLVLLVAVLAERIALARGVLAVHQLGLRLRGWDQPVGAAVPPSIVPTSFPARDSLAPGREFDRSRSVDAMWLDGATISVFDRSKQLEHRWTPAAVSTLLTIVPGRGGASLRAQPYARFVPWLGPLAFFASVFAIEAALFSGDWAFAPLVKWLAALGYAGFVAAQLAGERRRIDATVAEVAAELQHRAQTADDGPSSDGSPPPRDAGRDDARAPA
ncbi:MAG: hypothetical protein AAF721_00565 [Myxococcota bacterium]